MRWEGMQRSTASQPNVAQDRTFGSGAYDEQSRRGRSPESRTRCRSILSQNILRPSTGAGLAARSHFTQDSAPGLPLKDAQSSEPKDVGRQTTARAGSLKG